MKHQSKQPLAVRSLVDMHVFQQALGTKPLATHQPEVPLGALPVIDTGSATSAIEDGEGNVHITVESTPSLHPILDKDTTMTITTSGATPIASNPQAAGAAQYVASQASAPAPAAPAPADVSVSQTPTQGDVSMTTATASATPATVVLPAGTPIVTTAAPAPAAGRTRRLFSAEPAGNFEEAYQASLAVEAQLGAVRQRLAHQSQHLTRHDAEIDDLQQDAVLRDNRIKALEDRKSSSSVEVTPLAAGATALAIGAGVTAGVAAVGILADWLFDTNIATLPRDNG